MRHGLKQDIANTLDNGIGLLTLIERIAKAGVDGDNLLDIPKHLLDKIGTAVCRDNVAVFEIIYPGLQGS